MKGKIHIKSLVLGTVLGALIVLTVAAASKSGSAVWEYREMYRMVHPGTANSPPTPAKESLEQRINAAATAGWEVTGYTADSVLLRRAKK